MHALKIYLAIINRNLLVITHQHLLEMKLLQVYVKYSRQWRSMIYCCQHRSHNIRQMQ